MNTGSPNLERNSGGCPTAKSQQSQDCDTGQAGNPIKTGIANKHQHETDYVFPGSLAPAFAREYNSRSRQLTTLGRKWRHSYDLRVTFETIPAQSITMARLWRADGNAAYFTLTNGAWIPVTADITETLQTTRDTGGAITSATYTLPDGTVETYGSVVLVNGTSTAFLLSVRDRTGLTRTFGYDSLNRLMSVTGPFGHMLTLGYDSQNRISTVSGPDGQVIGYAYDANKNLSRVSYPDGTAKLYHYENAGLPNHLTGISYADAYGTATRFATWGYDSSGLAVSSEHAGGVEHYDVSYQLNNSRAITAATVTDAAGTQEKLIFQTVLGVVNVASRQNLADGKTRYQTFDANNNLTCIQDEEGRVTTFTYNAANQKQSETTGRTGSCAAPVSTSATRTTTYRYVSTSLDLPTVVESPSVAPGQVKRTVTTYSGMLPVSITQTGYTSAGQSVSRAVSFGYNGAGQVTSIDGPRTDAADVTTLAYYTCTAGGGCGRPARVTNALGHTTTFDAYDAAGRLLQQSDPNGLKTAYTYDARGRVASMTQTPPTGTVRTTLYGYDVFGNVAQVTFPDGRTLAYSYNAANQLAQVTDNLGNRIAYGYDLKNNRTQTYTYDPTGTLVRSVDLAFDARNRVSQINEGGSLTKQVFDAVGNLTQVIDPNTNAANGTAATTNRYDALNRLFQTVDLLGGNTTHSYDVNDRVQSTAAPNGATTVYDYDDLGNLLREASPDRGVTTYSHDAAGNVVSSTDARGVTANYTYDALNRVVTIRYGSALASLLGTPEDVTYTWDSNTGCSFGIAQLCQVTDAAGTTQYAYDAFGNAVTQTHTELGIVYTTSYRYDAANRVASLTYPNGRVVNYGRDALGRLNTITMALAGNSTALVTARSYRPDGLLLSQTFGNGLSNIRAYNTRGQVIEQYLGSADTRLYSYDANGNLTGLQSIPQVGAYQYDLLNRLKQEDRTTQGTTHSSFTYDPNGNRLTDATGRYSYLALSNRLTNAPGGSITLDAAGNTVSDATRRYTYNNAGQLAAVADASYAYNHLRQRTRKVVAGQTTVYHYDLAGNLITETDAHGNLLRDYLWADGMPIAQVDLTLRGGRPLPARLPTAHLPAAATEQPLVYLHTDHLNTPRLGTDAQGQVVWRWDGTAFGETAPNENPDGDRRLTTVNLRFPGQYYDAETGLHYNWNRYYDPKIGRYVTSDPVGLRGGLNTYGYVGGNPLKYFDPYGLDLMCRTLYPNPEADNVKKVADAANNAVNNMPPWLKDFVRGAGNAATAATGVADNLTNLGNISLSDVQGNVTVFDLTGITHNDGGTYIPIINVDGSWH